MYFDEYFKDVYVAYIAIVAFYKLLIFTIQTQVLAISFSFYIKEPARDFYSSQYALPE